MPRGEEGFPQAHREEIMAGGGAPSSWRWTALPVCVIVLATLAAYSNSFIGPFIYDDDRSIAENQTIRQLWPVWQVLSPPCDGETVGGRPLLNLSLALNYALSGLDVWSYHAANLLIHVGVALLLFGILRRTFLTPTLQDRFGRAATPLALASALLWAVHPLHTESVTYVSQRAESLVGFFYLLTLYCAIRGAGSHGLGTVPFFAAHELTSPNTTPGEKGDCPPEQRPEPSREHGRLGRIEPARCPRSVSWDRPFSWYAAAIVACLLGMACKEIMVTAPLVVLLYDRTFLAGSFREALRQRRALYLGLAATWALLACLVFSTGLIGRQSEMGAPDPWSYARSQPGVILHYLRLSMWPSQLCLEYEWPVASSFGEIAPGAVVVALLLAATTWGLIRRKAYGFLGAWCLLLLAPTSSILPLGQLASEHRMYLSLAAVAVLLVAGGYALWDRLLPRLAGSGQRAQVERWVAPVGVLVVVLVALGYATRVRNCDYQSAIAIWTDQVEKHPNSSLSHNYLGIALAAAGSTSEAIEQFSQALKIQPNYAAAHNNLGLALVDSGKIEEALEHYREALRLTPDSASAYTNLGSALARLGKPEEAIEYHQKALRLNPNYAEAYTNLGNALAALGRTEEAIEQFEESLRLAPDFAMAYNNLAVLLAGEGKAAEATVLYAQVLRLSPDDPQAHTNLGNALAALGRSEEAIQQHREALRLKPDYAEAHTNLGAMLARSGRIREAIEHYTEALRLKPDFAEAHNNLGIALIRAGRIEEALQHWEQALRLKPDYVDAHNNLGIALVKVGRIQEALQHWEQALRLNPRCVDAHNKLALALADLGRTNEAMKHYHEVLQLVPDSIEALSGLAWLLATREPAEGDDAARAVQLAQRACELTGQENAQCLDALAAAYAAAGRFPEAVTIASKGVRLAESTGQATLAKSLQSRLELYRAGRPYREPSRPQEKAGP